MDTNWKSKAEYLQFVQDWKRNYKALSAFIRDSRLDGRIKQSQFAGGLRYERVTQEELSSREVARGKSLGSLKTELGSFWDASSKATELLEVRKEHKLLAGLARAAAVVELKTT